MGAALGLDGEDVMHTRRTRAITLGSSTTSATWIIVSLLAGALALIAWCAVSV